MTTQQFKEELLRRSSPLVIAISGFGGAGKSTLATWLAGELKGAVVVSGDDFTSSQQQARCDDWSTVDRARIAEQVLQPAQSREPISYQKYDWPNDCLGEWCTIAAYNYLIIEGIGLIHPDLLPQIDITAWLDVPLEVASQQGKFRDRDVYKVDHDSMWDDVWTPNDRDYFDLFKPTELVDFIVSPLTRQPQRL